MQKLISILSAAIVLIFIPVIATCQELDKKGIGEKNIKLLFSKELGPGDFYYKPKKTKGFMISPENSI